MRLSLDLALKQLDSSRGLLRVHEGTGDVLADVGVHAVDAIQPEVLQPVGILAERVCLLGVVGFGALEADVLGHLLGRCVHPLFFTHGLHVARFGWGLGDSSTLGILLDIGRYQLVVIQVLTHRIMLLLYLHQIILHLIEHSDSLMRVESCSEAGSASGGSPLAEVHPRRQSLLHRGRTDDG